MAVYFVYFVPYTICMVQEQIVGIKYGPCKIFFFSFSKSRFRSKCWIRIQIQINTDTHLWTEMQPNALIPAIGLAERNKNNIKKKPNTNWMETIKKLHKWTEWWWRRKGNKKTQKCTFYVVTWQFYPGNIKSMILFRIFIFFKCNQLFVGSAQYPNKWTLIFQ